MQHQRAPLFGRPGQLAVVEVRVHLLHNVLRRRALALTPDLVRPGLDPHLERYAGLVRLARPWVHESGKTDVFWGLRGRGNENQFI